MQQFQQMQQVQQGSTVRPSRICNKVLQDFDCRWEGAIWHNSTVFAFFWGGSMDVHPFFSVHRVPRCIGKRNMALVSLFNICKYPQRWKVPPPDKCGIVHTYPCHDTDMCGTARAVISTHIRVMTRISVDNATLIRRRNFSSYGVLMNIKNTIESHIPLPDAAGNPMK